MKPVRWLSSRGVAKRLRGMAKGEGEKTEGVEWGGGGG